MAGRGRAAGGRDGDGGGGGRSLRARVAHRPCRFGCPRDSPPHRGASKGYIILSGLRHRQRRQPDAARVRQRSQGVRPRDGQRELPAPPASRGIRCGRRELRRASRLAEFVRFIGKHGKINMDMGAMARAAAEMDRDTAQLRWPLRRSPGGDAGAATARPSAASSNAAWQRRQAEAYRQQQQQQQRARRRRRRHAAVWCAARGMADGVAGAGAAVGSMAGAASKAAT